MFKDAGVQHLRHKTKESAKDAKAVKAREILWTRFLPLLEESADKGKFRAEFELYDITQHMVAVYDLTTLLKACEDQGLTAFVKPHGSEDGKDLYIFDWSFPEVEK